MNGWLLCTKRHIFGHFPRRPPLQIYDHIRLNGRPLITRNYTRATIPLGHWLNRWNCQTALTHANKWIRVYDPEVTGFESMILKITGFESMTLRITGFEEWSRGHWIRVCDSEDHWIWAYDFEVTGFESVVPRSLNLSLWPQWSLDLSR